MNTGHAPGDQAQALARRGHQGRFKAWAVLFSFTIKAHLSVFISAVIFSAAAGLLQPSMAIIFGRVFDAFSDCAARRIDGMMLVNRTLGSVYALLGIGVCTFLLKGSLFTLWLVFGEMQAKSVRETLFQCLLEREIEWYNARTTGVSILLARMQTYDTYLGLFVSNDPRQIQDLQLGTSQPLGFSIVALVQALSSLGLAFHTNWRLTLVVLSIVPVIAVGCAIISHGMQTSIDCHSQRLTQATRVAKNAISNILTIKCFNTQNQERHKYAFAVREAAVFSLKLTFSEALQAGFIRFASTIMFVQGKFVQVPGALSNPHEYEQDFGMVAPKSILAEPPLAMSLPPSGLA